MVRAIIITLLAMLLTSSAFAAEFSPHLLKLSAYLSVQYDFDGSRLDIPVTVSGSSAGMILLVFTKDWAQDIEATHNGYLGWHYVNKVDTCIYFSPLKSVPIGQAVVSWDGHDQDGAIAQAGDYTYYIWAFDNQGDKEPVLTNLTSDQTSYHWGFDMSSEIQEIDENGLPMANPIWHQSLQDSNSGVNTLSRWVIGSDPHDKTQLVKSIIKLEDGWDLMGDPILQADYFESQYIRVGNASEQKGSMQKARFVPGGEGEIDMDWGAEAPYADIFPTVGGGSAGVATDGTYLFTTDSNYTTSNDPDADFYIYDMDGFLVEEVDISSWWSSASDFDNDGQMNGGPVSFSGKGGYVVLNSHTSCLNQMLDPARYLDSGVYDDLFVWSNGNGDYTLDKNFEETAERPWVCNDYNVGPYKYSISFDGEYFSAVNANDIGAVSFGLLGPDGTGLGYFTFADEIGGRKAGPVIIDSNTPFDGIYFDRVAPTGPRDCFSNCPDEYRGIYFYGHDVVKGLISGPCNLGGYYQYLNITNPIAGEIISNIVNYQLNWVSNFSDSLNIEFSSDNGETWTIIAEKMESSPRTYDWRIPALESDRCKIRLTDPVSGSVISSSGTFTIESVVAVASHTPHAFTLSQNSPNPFNPVTSIPFTLGHESHVSLSVYNIAGEKVTELAEGRFPAGAHNVSWDASEFASGVYFYRIVTGDFIETRKMMLVK